MRLAIRMLVVAALALPALPVVAGEVVVTAMSVPEMKADGALIVDIRRPDEWAATGVIDGAELVTFTDPESFLAAVGPELADGRDLVLVCHSGRRSGAAAEALKELIPNRIISQDGGMSALIGEGYQAVPPG